MRTLQTFACGCVNLLKYYLYFRLCTEKLLHNNSRGSEEEKVLHNDSNGSACPAAMNPISKTVKITCVFSSQKKPRSQAKRRVLRHRQSTMKQHLQLHFCLLKGQPTFKLPRSHLVPSTWLSIKTTCEKLPIFSRSQLSPGTCAKWSTTCPTFQDQAQYHMLYNLLRHRECCRKSTPICKGKSNTLQLFSSFHQMNATHFTRETHSQSFILFNHLSKQQGNCFEKSPLLPPLARNKSFMQYRENRLT